jgi:hypothetical protein
MKKLTSLFVFILFFTVAYPQNEFKLYSTIKKEVISYLDSTLKKESDHLYHNGYEKSSKLKIRLNPCSISDMTVYDENAVLISKPNSPSSLIEHLRFGETIHIPHFYTTDSVILTNPYMGNLAENIMLNYSNEIDGRNNYIFVFLDNGKFGFVKLEYIGYRGVYNPNEPGDKIRAIQGTNMFYISKDNENTIRDFDYKKLFFFKSNDVLISDEKKKIVYSVNFPNDSCYQQIFEFDPLTLQNKHILNGFSPQYIENSILFWTKLIGEPEKIHLYHLDNQTDQILYNVPDSLTLYRTRDETVCRFQVGKNKTKEGMELFLTIYIKEKGTDYRSVSIQMDLNGTISKIWKNLECGGSIEVPFPIKK